jgi:hypothetical protein
MTQFTCKGVKQINNRISFKHLYHSYLSAFFISAEVPNGEFPEILIAKCRSRFYCTWFFLLGGGKGVCRRWMSPARETQSTREIRLLRGRLPRKGGGLTGMPLIWTAYLWNCVCHMTNNTSTIWIFEVIFVVFRLMRNIIFKKTESCVGRNTSDHACQIFCSKSNCETMYHWFFLLEITVVKKMKNLNVCPAHSYLYWRSTVCSAHSYLYPRSTVLVNIKKTYH